MQTIIKKHQYTVIKPKNSITAVNAYLFEQQLITALRRNQHSILLVDLEKVEFLDSAGLMALISGCKLAQNLGTRFSVCSISSCLRIIIELTQLDKVLEVFENQVSFRQTL